MSFQHLPTTAEGPLPIDVAAVETETHNVFPFDINIFFTSNMEYEEFALEMNVGNTLISADDMRKIYEAINEIGTEHFRSITAPVGLDDGRTVAVKSRNGGETIEEAISVLRNEIYNGHTVYLYMIVKVKVFLDGENKDIYKVRYGI